MIEGVIKRIKHLRICFKSKKLFWFWIITLFSFLISLLSMPSSL